jgi:hypothetical protein
LGSPRLWPLSMINNSRNLFHLSCPPIFSPPSAHLAMQGSAADSASAPAAGPTVVRDLQRTSAVIGAVDVEVGRCEVDVLIEGCTDCTLFVTAALRSLTLRSLTRCTVVAAPSTATVALSHCSECTVTAAAPSVVASDVVGCLLFVASRTPVSVGGASRDVRLGPYNAVGDGLLSSSGMREWVFKSSGGGGGSSSGGGSAGSSGGSSSSSSSSAGDTFCRLDSAAASCVRAITPADFFWRYLPVPQQKNEHLPLPASYATPELPPDLARLDTRDTARSQRIESLTQLKFIVSAGARIWGGAPLLSQRSPLTLTLHAPPPPTPPLPWQNWMQHDSKIAALKNIFRSTQ